MSKYIGNVTGNQSVVFETSLVLPTHNGRVALSFWCCRMSAFVSVSVCVCQLEDSFVRFGAKHTHKGLARENLCETGKRRGKARSQSSQQ